MNIVITEPPDCNPGLVLSGQALMAPGGMSIDGYSLDLWVWRRGPRGGVRASVVRGTPDELRATARWLLAAADDGEAWLAGVADERGLPITYEDGVA